MSADGQGHQTAPVDKEHTWKPHARRSVTGTRRSKVVTTFQGKWQSKARSTNLTLLTRWWTLHMAGRGPETSKREVSRAQTRHVISCVRCPVLCWRFPWIILECCVAVSAVVLLNIPNMIHYWPKWLSKTQLAFLIFSKLSLKHCLSVLILAVFSYKVCKQTELLF